VYITLHYHGFMYIENYSCGHCKLHVPNEQIGVHSWQSTLEPFKTFNDHQP
jgi:hypothetical protein